MNLATDVRQWGVVLASAAALAIAGCGGGGGDDNDNGGNPIPPPTVEVSALPLPGPNPVACSNVAQDFSRVAPGANASDYWEGKPADNGQPQYITDLLADPANTLSFNLAVPNNDTLYGSFAGRSVPYAIIVCYPTSAANTRPNYPLPTGASIPRMQTGAAAPIFADATARYPVIVFSHGLADNPLKEEYLTALNNFASYGYIVVAPFHGDARVVDLRVEDIEDAARIVSRLRDFVALQALRPLSLTGALDRVLADAQWRDHIDTTQIGGFGASLGGEAMLLLGGAGLTTSAGLSWNSVGVDPRIKAAVGYVPYFGQPFLPAFGRDQHGLDSVTLPFLAISGTSDTTAPLGPTQQGISQLAGTRELVTLGGVKHGFDVPSSNDIYTWTLTFFDAEIRRLPAARQKLATMAKVTGGGDDRVVTFYNGQ